MRLRAWERLDEATVRWAFARLPEVESDHHPGWLQGMREQWLESGLAWADFRTRWATDHGMHAGREILTALAARFDTRSYVEVPYLFPELADTTEAMERAAIDAGQIQVAACHYVGVPRGLSRR